MVGQLNYDFSFVDDVKCVGQFVFGDYSLAFLVNHGFEGIGQTEFLFVGEALEYLHFLDRIPFGFVFTDFDFLDRFSKNQRLHDKEFTVSFCFYTRASFCFED